VKGKAMEDLRDNENRARFKNDSVNRMTPRSADGPIAGGSAIDPGNSVRGNPMPDGILNPNSIPMTLNPHQNFKGSHQNLTNKPADKNRSAEPGRRIYSRDTAYKY
jgi:hypothetical protein